MQKSLKRYTVTGIVLTIIAGMAAHFIYQWSDENLVAALFVPVNESVWEHLKLLFFPMVIYSIFETLLLHNDFPELFYADAIGIFIGMLSIVVLFYTYSGVLGRNCTPVDIGIFCFSVILAFLTRYFLVQKKIGLHQWKWLQLLLFWGFLLNNLSEGAVYFCKYFLTRQTADVKITLCINSISTL